VAAPIGAGPAPDYPGSDPGAVWIENAAIALHLERLTGIDGGPGGVTACGG
jgi:hypothetical protein